MRVEFVDSIPSTQEFLVSAVREGRITPPFALAAKEQTQGIGSRNNTWSGLEGNLFFSFCMQAGPSWAEIFKKFEIEFEKSREFITHFEGEEILLKEAKLLPDGSLEVDGRRVFSLR